MTANLIALTATTTAVYNQCILKYVTVIADPIKPILGNYDIKVAFKKPEKTIGSLFSKPIEIKEADQTRGAVY